ncbi:16S rRNA (guanine(966)-N(2))-methyltransferase RsmD, partial [Dysosmobacter welbionis]
VRSMSPRITSASWLKGVTERTRSLELTVMERLGFTSSITTESTALAPRQLLMPKAPQHMTTRAAATARGAQRRFFFGASKGRTVPACGPQAARMRSSGSGAACSTAVRRRCSSSRSSKSVCLLPCELELFQSPAVFGENRGERQAQQSGDLPVPQACQRVEGDDLPLFVAQGGEHGLQHHPVLMGHGG